MPKLSETKRLLEDALQVLAGLPPEVSGMAAVPAARMKCCLISTRLPSSILRKSATTFMTACISPTEKA